MTGREDDNHRPTGEPPGWQPDPWKRADERWWNGFEWTDRTRDQADGPPADSGGDHGTPDTAPRQSRHLPGGSAQRPVAGRWAAEDPPHAGWWPDPYGEADERWWDGERWTDRTDEIHTPGQTPTWTPTKITVLVGVALLIAIIVSISGGDNSPQTPSPPQASGSEIEAWLACQDFTRRNLRAPATAEFPSRRDATITRRSDEWVVTAYVDAENAFGATLRSEWRCTARKDGDTWRGSSTLLD